jgi:hypothetical protein
MSGQSRKRNELPRQEDGYPFDTGDWAKWTNVKRLNWLCNFRDRLRDKGATTYYKRYGLSDEQMEQMERDVDAMEKLVEKEQAVRKLNEAVAKALLPGVDDSALRAAFASGDKRAVDLEFAKWFGQLQDHADKDPKFATWFEEFCKDQERLLRWDDEIGEN